MGSAIYPDINGIRYDWSSVEITVGSSVILGIKDINYDGALDPGELRGTRSMWLGRTRGTYKASCSMTMYKIEGENLIALLGQSGAFMEVPFGINVNYADIGQPVINDIIIGARIKKHADAPKEGAEPASMKFDLHILKVKLNGNQPTSDSIGG